MITHDDSFNACNGNTVTIVSVALYGNIRQINQSPHKCNLIIPAFAKYLFRRSIHLRLFIIEVLLSKHILFCRPILLILVLDISIRIHSLDRTHNIGVANNKTLTSFATLLCVRRENITEARISIWGQKSRRIDCNNVTLGAGAESSRSGSHVTTIIQTSPWSTWPPPQCLT